MRRSTQSAAILMDEVNIRRPRPVQSLEAYFIVLENLIVSADKMGVYNAQGKTSDAIYSEALKKHASKWIHAADTLSEGELDLRTDDIADGLAWESIALEAVDNRTLFKKVIDTIWKIIKEIASFIRDFFDFSNAKLIVVDHKAIILSKALDKVKGKKPQQDEVTLSSTLGDWFYFDKSNSSNVWPVRDMLDRTMRVFEVISDEYLKMVDTSDGDIVNTLKAAFDANFEDQNRNDDLYRAIEVYQPSKIANKTYSASKTEEGIETRPLLRNTVLLFKDAPESKGDGIAKIRTALQASVQVKRKEIPHHEGEYKAKVMEVSELHSILEVVDKARDFCDKNKSKIKGVQNIQKKLDDLAMECVKSTEDKEGSTSSAALVAEIVKSTNQRMVQPIIVLQKLLCDGMDAALALCAQHLRAYEAPKSE